jgi:TAG lipase / steryl ester hydrolase / phospholipase A2 / LPA acyltransferase
MKSNASEATPDQLLAADAVLATETDITLEATASLECSRTTQPDARCHHDKYSDLHKGELRKFTEPLDRFKIERELDGLEAYSQFQQAAKRLGDLCNFENWRNNDRPESCDYDVSQLQHRIRKIQQARHSRDPEKMFYLLRTQVSRYVSGINEELLFHPFLLGTKKLIEEYVDAVCDLIDDFTNLCLSDGTCYDQLRFAELFGEVTKSYGKTAGLFSGGGTLGMRHVGTIKGLYETGNLPRVISGSSAGSIVCAVLCSKTDENLQRVLENFCHGDLKVFVGNDEPSGWLYRLAYFWSNGHFFDSKNLERVMKYHLGDVTFLEAYRRTGRILNVSIDARSS